MLKITISNQESVDNNYEYGFRHLSEIALKALSPGINDPGTAIISLRVLVDLLCFRANIFPSSSILHKNVPYIIYLKELSFDTLFERVIWPIWDYGKEDRMLQEEFKLLLSSFH